MRVLALVSARDYLPPMETLRQMERDDAHPRDTLFEDELGCDVVDEAFVARAPRARRLLYRALPMCAARVIETWMVRRRYDVVITWVRATHAALRYAAAADLFPFAACRADVLDLATQKGALPAADAGAYHAHPHVEPGAARFRRAAVGRPRRQDHPDALPRRSALLAPAACPLRPVRGSGQRDARLRHAAGAVRGLDLPCEIIASRWALSPEAQAMADEKRLPAG